MTFDAKAAAEIWTRQIETEMDMDHMEVATITGHKTLAMLKELPPAGEESAKEVGAEL